MANTFEGTNPITRDLDIEGYEVRVKIDADGLHFTRKGDRHKVKPTVHVTWGDIAEIGAERQHVEGSTTMCAAGCSVEDCTSFYEHLGLEDVE